MNHRELIAATARAAVMMLLVCAQVRAAGGGQDADFYVRLGNSFLEGGQCEKAIAMFQKARELDPDAAVGGGLAAAHSRLGGDLMRKGEYRDAIAHYEEARKLDPGAQILPNLEKSYRSLAARSLEGGDIEGALWCTEKALAISLSPESHRIRGEAFLKKGDFEQAIKHFTALAGLSPDDDEARMKVGLIYEKLGKGKEAAATYSEIIDRNPQFVPAYLALGEYYERRGYPARAAEVYRSGIEKAPADPSLHTNLAWLRIGEKNYLDAYKECTTALDLDPGNAYANNYLGLILTRINRFPEAQEAFKKSLAGKPDYLGARLNLAFLYGLMGRTEEAIREYKTALEQDPESAEAHFNIGMSYKKEGRYVLARYHLERAAKLYGLDSALGRRALERVQETD